MTSLEPQICPSPSAGLELAKAPERKVAEIQGEVRDAGSTNVLGDP